jgi:hypothetical protein
MFLKGDEAKSQQATLLRSRKASENVHASKQAGLTPAIGSSLVRQQAEICPAISEGGV